MAAEFGTFGEGLGGQPEWTPAQLPPAPEGGYLQPSAAQQETPSEKPDIPPAIRGLGAAAGDVFGLTPAFTDGPPPSDARESLDTPPPVPPIESRPTPGGESDDNERRPGRIQETLDEGLVVGYLDTANGGEVWSQLQRRVAPPSPTRHEHAVMPNEAAPTGFVIGRRSPEAEDGSPLLSAKPQGREEPHLVAALYDHKSGTGAVLTMLPSVERAEDDTSNPERVILSKLFSAAPELRSPATKVYLAGVQLPRQDESGAVTSAGNLIGALHETMRVGDTLPDIQVLPFDRTTVRLDVETGDVESRSGRAHRPHINMDPQADEKLWESYPVVPLRSSSEQLPLADYEYSVYDAMREIAAVQPDADVQEVVRNIQGTFDNLVLELRDPASFGHHLERTLPTQFAERIPDILAHVVFGKESIMHKMGLARGARGPEDLVVRSILARQLRDAIRLWRQRLIFEPDLRAEPEFTDNDQPAVYWQDVQERLERAGRALQKLQATLDR